MPTFLAEARLVKTKDNPREYLFTPGGAPIPMLNPGAVCGLEIAYDHVSKFVFAASNQINPGDLRMMNVTNDCGLTAQYSLFFDMVPSQTFVPIAGVFYGLMPDLRVARYDTATDTTSAIGEAGPWVATEGPIDGRYADHFIYVSPQEGPDASVYRVWTASGVREKWISDIAPEGMRVIGIAEGDPYHVALLMRPKLDPKASRSVRVMNSAGETELVLKSPLPNGAEVSNPELTRDNELFVGATGADGTQGGIFRVDPGGVLQQVACAKEIWWMLLLD